MQSDKKVMFMKFFTPTCEVDLYFDSNSVTNLEMAAQIVQIP